MSSVDLSRLSEDERDQVYESLGLSELKRQMVVQLAEAARKAEAWARVEAGLNA